MTYPGQPEGDPAQQGFNNGQPGLGQPPMGQPPVPQPPVPQSPYGQNPQEQQQPYGQPQPQYGQQQQQGPWQAQPGMSGQPPYGPPGMGPQGQFPQGQPSGFFARNKVLVAVVGSVAVLALAGGGIFIATRGSDEPVAKPSASQPSITGTEKPSESKSSEPSESSKDPSEAPDDGGCKGFKDAKLGEMGVPIVDENFEFTVTDMKDGLAELDAKGVSGVAKGQYVTVRVKMVNVSPERQEFTPISFDLFDTSGSYHGVDLVVTFRLEGGDIWRTTKLAPGDSLEGLIAFDIPKDSKVVSMLLTDSMVVRKGVCIGLD